MISSLAPFWTVDIAYDRQGGDVEQLVVESELEALKLKHYLDRHPGADQTSVTVSPGRYYSLGQMLTNGRGEIDARYAQPMADAAAWARDHLSA